MSRYDINENTFNVAQEILSDQSSVFNVVFSTPTGAELVAAAPSETSAEKLAFALNRLRSRFLDCGSDRETIALARAFDAFMDHDAIANAEITTPQFQHRKVKRGGADKPPRVVVFADSGVTRSVAVQGFSDPDAPTCVVVDYDNRTGSKEDYELEMIGMNCADFNKQCLYIW